MRRQGFPLAGCRCAKQNLQSHLFTAWHAICVRAPTEREPASLLAPNVAKKQSTTAFQGRRSSCETPIRVLSPEFPLHAIWLKNVRSGFTPQSTALEGCRTGEICNCDVESPLCEHERVFWSRPPFCQAL